MLSVSRARENVQPCERLLGVIGGLESGADADFLEILSEAVAAQPVASRAKVVVEQVTATAARVMPTADGHAARTAGDHAVHTATVRDCGPAAPNCGPPARDGDAEAPDQLNILDAILSLASRGLNTIVLPSFASHVFIDQLRANSPLPIADFLAAIRSHIQSEYPTVRCIGIVTSPELQRQQLFERYFLEDNFQIRYASIDGECSAEAFHAACDELIQKGARLIIPAQGQLVPVARRVNAAGAVIIDPHRVYARYVLNEHFEPPARTFKLGVVGGVGPAATVDFLRKVVRNTPAHRDQDHLKILVEQNPQIPDRTAHLLGQGPDPTLALYATCRRLQAGNADLIAIPCNTAHAYIDVIQPHLHTPIINMLHATVDHIVDAFPGVREVGLLATTGTLSSGIYHRALESRGLGAAVPPSALQKRMMEAIYGARGIKAGFTSGPCVDAIHQVIDELVSRDVEVIVLACTELPLVLSELSRGAGNRVALVDPTEILAVRCVGAARARL